MHKRIQTYIKPAQKWWKKAQGDYKWRRFHMFEDERGKNKAPLRWHLKDCQGLKDGDGL